MEVTIYVDGRKVEKEDLCKIEIKNENVKRIFAEKLRKLDNKYLENEMED